MTPVSRPPATVEAWQISNPPIFAMGPVRTSLELFDAVGMTGAARAQPAAHRLPGAAARRGRRRAGRCAWSPRATRPGGAASSRCASARGSADELTKRLRHEHGVIADAREPDVVRFAPVPLYSTYHDCWRAAEALAGDGA